MIEEENILIKVIDFPANIHFHQGLIAFSLKQVESHSVHMLSDDQKQSETPPEHSRCSLWSYVYILCLLQLQLEYLAFRTFHIIPKNCYFTRLVNFCLNKQVHGPSFALGYLYLINPVDFTFHCVPSIGSFCFPPLLPLNQAHISCPSLDSRSKIVSVVRCPLWKSTVLILGK